MHKNQIYIVIVFFISLFFNFTQLWAEEPTKEAKKWNFSASLGGEYNEGNVRNFGLKSKVQVERNDSILSFNSLCKYVLRKENGDETNNGIEAAVKVDWFQHNIWSPFVAVEYFANKHKGYEYQICALTGGKFKIYEKEKICNYSISAAFVFDQAEYTTNEKELDNINYRISIRPKMRQKIGEAVTIKALCFYQPSIFDISDYHILSQFVFECKISTHFFFDVNFDYERRNKVPSEEYKKDDFSTEFSLTVKF